MEEDRSTKTLANVEVVKRQRMCFAGGESNLHLPAFIKPNGRSRAGWLVCLGPGIVAQFIPANLAVSHTGETSKPLCPVTVVVNSTAVQSTLQKGKGVRDVQKKKKIMSAINAFRSNTNCS